jgi:hypothetical protein
VRLGSAERLGDRGGVAEERREDREGLVERHRALLVERRTELGQGAAQLLARAGLQRRQHLVELDRDPGLADRDRVPVIELLGRRRAGVQVDEEVALEEGPGADLGGRVAAHRQSLVLDRDDRGRAVTGAALDLFDDADVHARDPHRAVRPQVVGGAELDLDLVLVDPGELLGRREPEAADERDDDPDRDQDGGDQRFLVRAPGHGPVTASIDSGVVWSVVVPWLPGTLPICWPGM